ncbi:MAG: hypothetical protein QXG86_02100 [Candidatus Woesearchaeota archaeon]
MKKSEFENIFEKIKDLSSEERINILKSFEKKRIQGIKKVNKTFADTEQDLKRILGETEENWEKRQKNIEEENLEDNIKLILNNKEVKKEERNRSYGELSEALKNLYNLATENIYVSLNYLRDKDLDGTPNQGAEKMSDGYSQIFSRKDFNNVPIKNYKVKTLLVKEKGLIEQIKKYHSGV